MSISYFQICRKGQPGGTIIHLTVEDASQQSEALYTERRQDDI